MTTQNSETGMFPGSNGDHGPGESEVLYPVNKLAGFPGTR